MSTLVSVSIVVCALFGSVSSQTSVCTAFDPIVGSDCVPDSGDFPSQCLAANPPSSTLTVTDKIECSANFDCCTCETITCNSCTQANCNGDSSCIVTNFILNGDSSNGGVTIDCNGDISCAGSTFTATEVKEIKCSGDDACAFTDGTLDCINEGCRLECAGDCACPNSDLEISNVLSVECVGDDSCGEASITVDDIAKNDEFSVSCDGEAACKDAEFDITISSSSITGIKGVSCGSVDACDNLVLNIDASATGNNVVMEKFECGGASACDNLTFNFVGVSIDECVSVPNCNSVSECSNCN